MLRNSNWHLCNSSATDCDQRQSNRELDLKMTQAKMQQRTLVTLCAVLLASAAFWLTLIGTILTPHGTLWMGLAYSGLAVVVTLAMISGYLRVKGLICVKNRRDEPNEI